MTNRVRDDGFSVVEALVAAALAGLALAALSTAAALARRSLVQARDSSVALALATDRLEALRAGPRADGSDVLIPAGGVTFAREWTIADGRGGPTAIRVQVRWGERALTLATEVPP